MAKDSDANASKYLKGISNHHEVVKQTNPAHGVEAERARERVCRIITLAEEPSCVLLGIGCIQAGKLAMAALGQLSVGITARSINSDRSKQSRSKCSIVVGSNQRPDRAEEGSLKRVRITWREPWLRLHTSRKKKKAFSRKSDGKIMT
ncbi:hypothetical protein OH492_15280 [Vibrio chagasii]|nr:hypothetical protein [Vibrio chagasii]